MKNNPAIKTLEQIKGIRKACILASKTLDFAASLVEPMISTEFLNKELDRFIRSQGGIPAPLNYRGYPKSICTSVNDVVCHGIPSETCIFKKGDIVNIDVTVILDGYFGDSSRMFYVGSIQEINSEARKLVEASEMAMYEGISVIREGAYLNDIGIAIESFLARNRFTYGIVREYTGHGTGLAFHEWPQVYHFNSGSTGPKLEEGMVFTIEPMINQGTWKTKLDSDGWTVRTADGGLSAQWEHTVLVCKHGVEILTYS